MPHFIKRRLLAVTLLALAVGAPGRVFPEGGKWELNLDTKDQEKVSEDVDGIKKYERTRERNFDVSFDTLLQPTLQFKYKLEFSRKIDDSSSDFDSTEDSVKTESTLTAQWWELMLGFEETDTKSDDPDNEFETTHTIKGELKIEPEYENLPDFSYKFESSEDSDTQNYTANFEYEIAKMFSIKAEAQKDLTDNTGKGTDNTDARKFKGELSFKRDFWTMWQVEATATHTRDQQLSLDNGGYLIEKQDKITNEYNTKLATNPLEWIDYSLEYKLSENEDLMADTPVESTGNLKNTIKLSPEFLNALSMELGYTNEFEDTSGTDTASKKCNNEYNLASKFEAMEILTLDLSYDRKDNQESPKSSGEATKTTRDDDYKATLDLGVWEDQIALKVDREFKYSWQDSELTTNQNTWNVEADITWDHVPNLEVKPKYTWKNDEDRIEGKTTDEKTLEANLIYTISLGDVTEIKLDHTYKRVGKEPGDDTPDTIQREDSTKFGLKFSDFLRGMNFEATWERSATDESMDDVGPEIDFKYGLKYDWDVLEHYKLTTTYEFNDNQESGDEEKYKAELATKIFKDAIEITTSYEKSQKFGADGTIEQTYLIEVSGKL